ncbi:dynamin-related protein 4C [Prunus yedoensis var. nudiflora]|uniref:Dynamin-related protein 4C n=1 Tax=Prunus yedoensis var. nudiflora TaxID=2094558 RepID=A0A314ZH76_PRUYE|nr:dynamin-related protein 4C [Prunus yedoensis var. nudiflora]
MPKKLSSVAEAMTAVTQIIGTSKESLKKILVRGEFDEFPDDKHMHCTARLVEMLNKCSDQLHECTRGKVKGISSIPIGFVEQRNTENYYHVQLSARRAGHNLIEKKKERSINWMTEILEMEKLTDYTCNPEYLSEWHRLMTKQETFIQMVLRGAEININVEGIGMVEVGGLRKYSQVLLSQAFDLKMRMTAYWNVVLRRLIDIMGLHLQLSVSNLVNKDMEMEIMNELLGPNHGGGIERMLEEPPSMAVKRQKLIKSIKKLKESKEVMCKIMDDRFTYADYLV